VLVAIYGRGYRSSSGRVTKSQGEGSILGVVRDIQKHWQSSPQLSLPRCGKWVIQSAITSYTAEGIIQYARQAQIGSRKIAGVAAYRQERG